MIDKDVFFEKLLFSNPSLGDNSKEIERLWNIYLNYRDGNEISRNILDSLLDVKENIQIFSSERTNYLKMFGALELNISLPDSDIIHELGHLYYNLVLFNKIPDDFDEINQRAKEHSRMVSNVNFSLNGKEVTGANFRVLLEELCQKDNLNSEKRDEIAPFSDIISAINLGVNRFETKDGSAYILPYSHSFEYYEQDDVTNYPLVFDEQFANFFALTIMNQTEKLDILRKFFGEEWFLLMTNTLLEIEAILLEERENKNVL